MFQSFSRGFQRDGRRTLDGFGGAGLSSLSASSGRHNWRSKADEDRVWTHDKFIEGEQEEIKLELVDEVGREETTMPSAKHAYSHIEGENEIFNY